MTGAQLHPQFWRDRRVLITGHTGFKGTWLALWLQEMGADVAGFARGEGREGSLFDTACVGDGMRSMKGDAADLDALSAALVEHRAEIVFHLAAQSIVSRSLTDPAATFAANVMGTVNVLEAARRGGGVRALVNVTTDRPFDGRGDPYRASKACSELVTSAYQRSFFEVGGRPAVATARAGNVIGGGDLGEDRLIPDVMRAALGGRPAQIRSPLAIRPWQHVLNPLSGYLLLAEGLFENGRALGRPWCFGPDKQEAWTVERVIGRLRELWGEPIPVELGDGGVAEGDRLKLDSSAARSMLGWTPGWGIEAGLQAVVDWHRRRAAGDDSRQVTTDQIRAHPAAATAAGSLA